MQHIRLMSAAGVALLGLGLAANNAQAQQPAPTPTILGEYALAQAGASELPVLISEEEGCRREITAATLTLQPDNKWSMNASVRETCGETVTEKTARQAGTYTQAEQAVTFQVVVPEEQNEEEAANVIALDPITAGQFSEGSFSVTWGEDRPALVFRR